MGPIYQRKTMAAETRYSKPWTPGRRTRQSIHIFWDAALVMSAIVLQESNDPAALASVEGTAAGSADWRDAPANRLSEAFTLPTGSAR
jgi:hypothetical protein